MYTTAMYNTPRYKFPFYVKLKEQRKWCEGICRNLDFSNTDFLGFLKFQTLIKMFWRMNYHLFYTYVSKYFLDVTQFPKYVCYSSTVYFPMISLLQTSTEILEFNRDRGFFPLKFNINFRDFYWL